MLVVDRGFRFQTLHTPQGERAQVRAFYSRAQTQAPIARSQKFEMEFYGRGGGMVLGVQALPRRATQQSMRTLQRERAAAVRTREVAATATTLSTATAMPTATPTSAITATRAAAASSRALTTRTSSLVSGGTAPPGEPAAGATARFDVGPDFHSPFDENW